MKIRSRMHAYFRPDDGLGLPVFLLGRLRCCQRRLGRHRLHVWLPVRLRLRTHEPQLTLSRCCNATRHRRQHSSCLPSTASLQPFAWSALQAFFFHSRLNFGPA